MSLLDTIKQSEEPKTLHQGHWIEVTDGLNRVFVWCSGNYSKEDYISQAIESLNLLVNVCRKEDLQFKFPLGVE